MTQFYVDQEAPHLGGYCIGGDEATRYEVLWRWLVGSYGVRSVIDVGCGEGHSTRYFSDELEIEGFGVDGINQIPIWSACAGFSTHDYTTGPWGDMSFDLCWCCEFVEHVEERYIPNFLETFKCAETVLMTHAFPGQSGHHHVACKVPDFWKGVMAAIGYRFNPELTALTRELASENKNPHNHFARSGLAFERNSG